MSAHVETRTYLTERDARWSKVLGLPKWYRCAVCGSLSTVPLSGECPGLAYEEEI